MSNLITPSDYYSNSSNYGDYQYVSLNDMLTNFILNYVGDDKLINNISRHTVLFHLKRGLQELNYEALKEIKVTELEMSDNLTIPLPHDYVNYVRISWVDSNGKLRPMLKNTKSAIANEYLQDVDYNILFDNDGYPLKGSSSDINIDTASNYNSYTFNNLDSQNARFNLRTNEANVNGVFMIDKRAGVIQFSSNVEYKNIVIEYISDGMEYLDSSDIKVNKLAEQALYDYVSWVILDTKYGIQEYIVARMRKKYINSKKRTKMRIGGLRYDELLQALRGQNKWIK